MNIVYINTSHTGNSHEIIDSALIGMLSARGSLKAYACEDRIPCLRQLMDKKFKVNSVEWCPVSELKLRRLRALRIALKEAYLMLKNNKNSIFLITYMNGYSSNLLNLISIVSRRKLILVAHNDVECVVSGNKITRGFQRYLHNYFFRYAPLAKNLKIMVLGDNVIQNLSAYLSNKRLSHFFSIDHPYYSNSIKDDALLQEEIHVGLPGRIDKRPSRGFENVCRFANMVLPDRSIKIHIISSIDEDLVDQLPPNVEVRKDCKKNLSRSEYEALIRQMDYILLPYHKDYYKFTVSGAIFEAITNLKPALVFSTNYFLYLKHKFGDYGFFVDQEDKTQLVPMLHNQQLYNKYIENEKIISKAINPTELSDSFYNLVDNLWV